MTRAPIKTQTLRLLRERGIEFGSVLDVGVLYGTDELIDIFSDLPHVLFEPVAEFAPHIAQRYRAIDHRVVQKAVSDKIGDVLLQTQTIIAGLDISHSNMLPDIDTNAPHVLAQHQQAQGPDVRIVQMTTLDAYLEQSPSAVPYFLKIDIDGHELLVLRGATQTLRNTSAAMIEVTTGSLVERVTAMQQAGFSLFDIVEPCYYDGALWGADAVFVRNDVLDKHFAHIHRDFNQAKYEIFRG